MTAPRLVPAMGDALQVWSAGRYLGIVWRLPEDAPASAYGVAIRDGWRGRWWPLPSGVAVETPAAGWATAEDAASALAAATGTEAA